MYDTLKDFASPIATVIAAIAALSVTAYFAWHQRDIAKEQARLTKESTLNVDVRRFDTPVDKIEGTVKSASFRGVELSESPGRVFHFSSVGSSMADLVADSSITPGPFGVHIYKNSPRAPDSQHHPS